VNRCDVIVVGGSWGGMSAVARLLGDLPADFPVPVVVVLHRGADSGDTLASILERGTPLRVLDADDKTDLSPGCVHVAPPGYHLLVERGSLALSTDAAVHYSRPSIDVTFETAAAAYGSGAVGVLLTGDNGDGAAGLAEVRRYGGTTIVEDPETAERPVMPRAAIARAAPDAVLPLELIGPRLVRLGSVAGQVLR
jgi:two-component system, chemotaxis family, protein-glutamate methylesterase/glutaminase